MPRRTTSLKKILKERGLSTGVGDEGGFAPDLPSAADTCAVILEAAERAGHRDKVAIALDPAASELYEGGVYQLRRAGGTLDAAGLIDLWADLADRYPIVSIEDGLAEDDWEGWQTLTDRLGGRLQLVGDDIFVTNVEFLLRGIDERVGNAILVKLNQIGTVTETMDAIEIAQHAGYVAVISPPFRRDRGHLDRRPGRGDERRADQDGRAGTLGPGGEVQPAASARGSAGRVGGLPGLEGLSALQPVSSSPSSYSRLTSFARRRSSRLLAASAASASVAPTSSTPFGR